jgi:hypothetical protein
MRGHAADYSRRDGRSGRHAGIGPVAVERAGETDPRWTPQSRRASASGGAAVALPDATAPEGEHDDA